VPDLSAGQRTFDSIDPRIPILPEPMGIAGGGDYKLAEGRTSTFGALLRFQELGDRWVYSLNDGAPPSFGTQLGGRIT